MIKLFAIDLGASGGKCFVGIFEDDNFRMEEVHRFAHAGATCFLPDRNGVVTERAFWDDIFIYQNIVRGLQTASRQFDGALNGIGIDTWGADGQLLTADGDALGKMYCYRDHRLDDMCDEVKERINAARMYEITGIHFQPFNLSNQLLWVAMHRPELLRQAAVYLPVPALFYYYLGGCVCVDSTFASVTQLMDAEQCAWSNEILKALKIPEKIMPEIVAPGVEIGRLQPGLADLCGLNQVNLISVGSHDTASAFAAAPVKNTKTALIISSGTWSLVGKLIRNPITSAAAMSRGFSNEGGIGNTRFLKNCMGTWIVQELLRIWEIEDGRGMSWREVDTLTPAAKSFTAFIDPDDPRFYNPANMEQAIMDFVGESGQTALKGRGEILRCVYESLALKYRNVNEDINAVTNTATDVVHIVGGGSNNELLNQFTANSIGVPVLAGPKEATAVGNIMVQAVGAAVVSDLQNAMPYIQAAFPIKQFDPREIELWNSAYARFVELLN